MHIDVNNAFLSWTAIYLLNHGYPYDIRNEVAVIGGSENTRHGIVLAKSNLAKKYGIKSAETIKEAKRKYHDVKVYPPYYPWYVKQSNKLFALLAKYTNDIEKWSIDEGLIDYTPIMNNYGDPIKFAYKLKDDIKKTLGFTVNIGIANNKLCAKMASDFTKPDKVHTLFKNEIEEKMYPLPIEDLFGIGKKTSQKLHILNIKTIKDLALADEVFLTKYFKNQAHVMIQSAQGIASDVINSNEEARKGISNETTLNHNLTDLNSINEVLYNLIENLGMSLRKEKKYAYVIAVKMRDVSFKTKTHQKKLVNATNSTKEIYNVCKKLAKDMYHDESIRLLGVSLSNLVSSSSHQMSLFEGLNDKIDDEKFDEVVDKLKERYGSNVINKASLIDKKMISKHY